MNETLFLKKVNKNDHIKKLFATLNFKPQGSTYGSFYGKLINHKIIEFDKNKEIETNKVDRTLHFKWSEIKNYEEQKIKHKIILRK